MGIRTNVSTGTEFRAHTAKMERAFPAPAKNVGTLVGYQGIRSRSWAKAPLSGPAHLKPWFRATPDWGVKVLLSPPLLRVSLPKNSWWKFETKFFWDWSKKSVTERPPESICITKTNSETKKKSFEKSFFRSQKIQYQIFTSYFLVEGGGVYPKFPPPDLESPWTRALKGFGQSHSPMFLKI